MKMSLKKLKELTEQLIDRDFVLKKKQEIMEALLESSPVPVLVWIVDQDLIFLDNGKNGKIPSIGIDNPDIYVGTSVYDFFKTTDTEQTPIKYLLETLKGYQVHYWLEYDDAKLWNKCFPLRNYENEIIGVVGITWDLTECSIKNFHDRLKDSPELESYIED